MAGNYIESTTVQYSNPLISVAMAEQIGQQYFGMVYTPCRLTLRGRPNQTAGDIIRAYDSNGDLHNVLVMEHTLVITGGLKATVKCNGDTSDNTEFNAGTGPTGQTVQQVNNATVKQLEAYANSGDLNVLAQAKKYTDEAIAQAITAALGGSY